jgi:RsiW-degrading membrane proteinase PrsW (M82 family)
VFIATVIPLLFLALVWILDVHSGRRAVLVLLSFLWGLASFFIVYWSGPRIFSGVDAEQAVSWVAPLVEEAVKALILIYLATRRDFAYLGDGAVYGFAVGVGFSIVENYLYVTSGVFSNVLFTALGRALSASLLHGSTSAVVGLGLAYAKGARMWPLGGFTGGLALAVSLHILYNQVLLAGGTFLQGFCVSLGAMSAVVGGSTIGLLRERWLLRGALVREAGVNFSEVQAVDRIVALDGVRGRVALYFGRRKAREVELLLLETARLGLAKQACEVCADPGERRKIGEDIQRLRQSISQRRKSIGSYCLLYVRAVFPGKRNLWKRLERRLAFACPNGGRSIGPKPDTGRMADSRCSEPKGADRA